MIEVKAVTATYAITHQTILSRTMEVAKGMITGNAPNVNMLRELTEGELEECECNIPVLSFMLLFYFLSLRVVLIFVVHDPQTATKLIISFVQLRAQKEHLSSHL